MKVKPSVTLEVAAGLVDGGFVGSHVDPTALQPSMATYYSDTEQLNTYEFPVV